MALRIPNNTQVRRAATPNATVKNYQTPQMLGAEATQLREAGQALGDVGQAAGQVAYARQQERNLAKVAAAEVQLGQQALEFEQAARSRKGWQADGLIDEATDWWQKASSERMEELENDAQRRAFAEIAAKRRMASLSRVSSHQQGELDRATVQTLEASVGNDINEAAANYTDPNAVAGSIQSITRKVNAMAAARGWGAEQREAYLSEQITTAHKAVIDNLIEADPNAAAAYYQANRDAIAGSDRAVIEKHLETAGRLGEAQRLSDEIVASGGTMSEQLEQARQIEDAETRKLARAQIRQYHADQAAALREAQDRAWNQTAKIIADGGSLEDIPPKLWDALSGDQHLKVQRLIRERTAQRMKPDPERSLRTYMSLRRLAQDNPEAFRNENLDLYVGVVDDARLRELVKLQEDDGELAVSRTRDQIIKQGVSSAGLDPNKLGDDSDAGREVAAFYDRIDGELQALQREKGGREPTRAEIQEIVDRLTIRVVRERDWWVDAETPAGRLEIDGIPTDMIDELAKAVRDAGQNVTEQNIITLYRYLQDQGAQ